MPNRAYAAERLPVEAFGQLPAISDVQVSPDGNHVAVLKRIRGRDAVAIYKSGDKDGEKPALFGMKKTEIDYIAWANNDRLLVAIRFEAQIANDWIKDDVTRLVSISTRGKDVKLLFRKETALHYSPRLTRMVDRLPADQDHVLVPAWNREARTLHLYKAHVTSGEASVYEQGDLETYWWMTDHTGVVRLRGKLKDNGIEFHTRLPGKPWKFFEDYTGDENSKVDLLAFSDRPETAYVRVQGPLGWVALHEYNLQSMTLGKRILAKKNADIDDVGIDPATGKLLFARYTVDKPELHFFDAGYKKLYDTIDKAFPHTVNSIISMNEDRTVLGVETSDADKPPVYYFFNARNDTARKLGQAYPDLADIPMGKVQKHVYRSGDGWAITAYLTLPPGEEAKNLPLIVMPHGGPKARDTMTFDFWTQFLANRGYAVLQPNFRGSTGYGKAFSDAGYGEWGGKMQDDVTDGVRYMIEKGIADRKRVCIVGASYGGYAALMGAVKTPNLYRCAASFAGVSDLIKFQRSGKKYLAKHYWAEHIGDPRENVRKLTIASPARQAHRIKAPVLLIHGKDDEIVLYDQSEMMASALRKAGKIHKLVPIKGGDHSLSSAAARIAMLREVESFLAQHLGN